MKRRGFLNRFTTQTAKKGFVLRGEAGLRFRVPGFVILLCFEVMFDFFYNKTQTIYWGNNVEVPDPERSSRPGFISFATYVSLHII